MGPRDYEISNIEDILKEFRTKINYNDVLTDDISMSTDKAIKEIQSGASNGLAELKEIRGLLDDMTLIRQAGARESEEREIFIASLNSIIERTCR